MRYIVELFSMAAYFLASTASFNAGDATALQALYASASNWPYPLDTSNYCSNPLIFCDPTDTWVASL